MKNTPTWQDEQKKISYKSLKQDLETEVCIIGGGLAGILTSYLLSKEGKSVVLIEKKKTLASDTTLYTTAFITQSIDTDLVDQVEIFGKKDAKLIWESHGLGIDLIERIVEAEKINCYFKRCSNFVYASREKDIEALKEEQEIYEELGIQTRLSELNDLPFRNFGYLEIPNQAKFHPIMFAQSLAEKLQKRGVKVFTETEATKLSEDNVVETPCGRISAKHVVVATYQPFNKPKSLALKKGMYQSFVLEARVKQGLLQEAIYEDMENPYHYFRVGPGEGFDYLILGGEDNKEIFKVDEKKHFAALKEYLKNLLPDQEYEVTREWTGPILEPSDGLALIGELRANQYVATAFSGNGMTYSAISAQLIKDLITGSSNPWARIYNPLRQLDMRSLAYKFRDYAGEFAGGVLKNAVRRKK